jgi:hypothetical protein
VITRLLCTLGCHFWAYAGAFVRPPDCTERYCACCGRGEFWSDGAWISEDWQPELVGAMVELRDRAVDDHRAGLTESMDDWR